MRKLSPFVRSRLGAQQRETGDHPDANVLLAFSERNVSRPEHAKILTHLEACAECREVLALSSSVSTVEASPSSVVAKRGSMWLRWPVAATAVLICSLVFIVWRPSLFESSPDVTSSSEPITTGMPASSVPAPAVSKTIEPDKARRQILAYKKKQAPPSRDATEFAEGLPHPPLTNSSNAAERSSEPSTVTAQQAIVEGPPRSPGVPPAPSSTPAPAASAKDSIVPKAMFSVAGSVAPVRTLLRSQRSSDKSVWSLEASPRGGTVRKSADGGRTWRTIPVDEATSLYALSATGSDVWVGGADGKLFHSVDDGAHWAAIPVTDESARFTGVIVGIDTRGENVTLKTSSRVTWTTDDDGAHWRRE